MADFSSFDWSKSDTPKGPYEPGNPRAVVISDANAAWDPYDPGKPPANSHGQNGGVSFPDSFYESNALYGDGHVESHTPRLKQWVKRDGWVYFPW